MALRQPRDRRHRSVRVQLTDRDRLVVEALGRFRLARTKDLQLVAFSSVHPMTARMRLRRLFDAGFLEVHSAAIGQENVYALGPKATDWKCGNVPKGSVAHHLGVVRGWSLIASGCSAAGLDLEFARPDWELRQEAAGAEIIPDLFMVFDKVALALEVDLGTEPQGVLRRKLERYDSLERLFGYPFVVSAMADRASPGFHVWSEDQGPGPCYELLLRQQKVDTRK